MIDLVTRFERYIVIGIIAHNFVHTTDDFKNMIDPPKFKPFTTSDNQTQNFIVEIKARSKCTFDPILMQTGF
jgi:hypothetical protein